MFFRPSRVASIGSDPRSSVCCVGQLYGAEELYSFGPFSSAGVHTALAALVLCLGVLSVSLAAGPFSLLLDDTVGGMFVRRLLPAAILLPIALGWFRLAGEQAGWYDLELGLSIFAISNVTVFVALVFLAASQVKRYDSRRRRADESRRESEKRYRLLLEGVPQLVWTCLPDGKCDYLSPQWVEYTGVPEERHLGFGWSEAVHPDDHPESRRIAQPLVGESAFQAYVISVLRNPEFRRQFRQHEHASTPMAHIVGRDSGHWMAAFNLLSFVGSSVRVVR